MELHTEVCIIGAGVAGLKTADCLLSRLEPSSIVILEAQDRIGGRIKTDTTLSKLGAKYDLGAAWFHDSLTNSVLHDFIADGSFDVLKDGHYGDEDVQVYASGVDGPLEVASLKLNRVAEDLEKFIEIHYASLLDVEDVSLRQIIEVFVEKYDAFLTNEQRTFCRRMGRYLELWYGISHDDISAKYAVMDHQGRNLYNKQGYGHVIEKLSAKVRDRIMLGSQVTRIERDIRGGSERHLVTTKDGTKIHANYVVVTVPQSVLQLKDSEHAIEWVPSLPATIQEGFESIHFGALGKVVLEFDSTWWDKKQGTFEVLADEQSGVLGGKPLPFQYPIYVVNYVPLANVSSLVVLIQSPVTEYLEANPEYAWGYLKPLLSKLSVETVTDPINVIVTDWTQNPFARGSYSAVHVGDDASDLLIQLSGEYEGCGLASSTVRFAGEHTIADGAGCVHGAYNSGIREAQWIMKHLE